MEKTNKISINGTVKCISLAELERVMKSFLEVYPLSAGRYKMVLGNDGDNLDISFNDASQFEINFQGSRDGFLVYVFNDSNDIQAIPIFKDIVAHLNSQGVLYNIEIQYEYSDGSWEDEDFFVHPEFKWD